jgi:hypothetical protein
MGRIFSGKPARDTEFAAESMINPILVGKLPKKNRRHSSLLTLTEQQQVASQIDDLSENKSR